MKRLAITLLMAVVAVLAMSLSASAQSFPDFRQAAGDQYGGNPPANPPGQPSDRPPDGPPDEPPGRPDDRPGRGAGGTQGENAEGGQGQGGGAADTGAARSLNLVFLSPIDPALIDGVNKVLARLGEPEARVLSLTEPLNLPGIATAAAGTRYSQISERRLRLVRALGRDVATELVKPSPFFDRLGPVLLTIDVPVTAHKYLVFARSGGKLATRAATRVRNAFEIGLAQGARKLRTRGIEIDGERKRIPIAGVETSATDPSQIGWYKKRKIPSVDNVETLNGQRALYEILRLRAKGHYGVKDTADSLLPKGIEADNSAATIDGSSDAGLGTGMAIAILLLMGAFTTGTAFRRMRRTRRSTS